MDLELVNPFVEASHDTFSSFLAEGIKQSDIDLLDKDTILKGVAVKISFIHKEASAALVNMEEAVAKKLVEIMTEETIEEWDEIGVSALGEFGNLICGAAVTKLEESGIDLDIHPPEIIFTKNSTDEVKVEQEAMAVKLDTNLGKIQVIVYLEQNF